jgi:hypothetical protein
MCSSSFTVVYDVKSCLFTALSSSSPSLPSSTSSSSSSSSPQFWTIIKPGGSSILWDGGKKSSVFISDGRIYEIAKERVLQVSAIIERDIKNYEKISETDKLG